MHVSISFYVWVHIMGKNSKLKELLNKSRFDDATSLLKSHLAKAELIDPSDDGSWTQYADQISFKILSDKGQDDFNVFWEELLKFFEEDLELIWGHLHKGHILFRLGLTKLVDDVASAKTYLEKALDEDRLLEKKRAGGKIIEIEKAVSKYSSYVMLCIIERIEDEHFDSDMEKQKFFQELVSHSFDAVIMGREIKPELVQESISLIVPQQALEQTLEARQELDIAYARQLQIATVSLAGAFLENILLGILYHQLGLRRTVQGKDILKVELGLLLSEAIRSAVFPSESIKATCQIIHIFRNRFHPGNELRQNYKLTPRVVATLKILLDLALVEWAKQISDKKSAQASSNSG